MNTRVGCHFPLQGIFLTQEWNLAVLHCRGFFTFRATREAGQEGTSSPPGQLSRMGSKHTFLPGSCLASGPQQRTPVGPQSQSRARIWGLLERLLAWMGCELRCGVHGTGSSGGWTCLLDQPLLPGHLLLAAHKLPFRGVPLSAGPETVAQKEQEPSFIQDLVFSV